MSTMKHILHIKLCNVYNQKALKGDGASVFLMTFLSHTKREERMFRCVTVCYHWSHLQMSTAGYMTLGRDGSGLIRTI